MTTKKFLIDVVLGDYPDDAIFAIPAIWTKADAEEAWESGQYADDETLTLTNAQWEDVVDEFLEYDFHDEESMVEAINSVLTRYNKENK